MSERTLDIDVEYSLLTGQEKAALVLSALGTSAVQSIFSHMKDNDVKRMINAMSSLRKAPIWMVKRILKDFHNNLSEEKNLLFPENKGQGFIIDALGEDRAKKLLGQVVDIATDNTLESLELVDTRTLGNFLMNEHPQTIALILAHLYSEKKVDVLRKLPEHIQADVILRMANLDYVSPELIIQLDDVLKNELSTLGSVDTHQLGGVEPVADMLNLMEKNDESKLISQIESKDPELAGEIKKLMFVFEDLIYVDDKGIQNLLKEVDPQRLAIALKTAPDEVKEKLFSNMSNRLMEIVVDEIDILGPTRISDVQKAQSEIIQKCKELESQEKLFISRGGEGDSFV